MPKKDKLPQIKEKKQSKTGRPRKFEGPTQNFYITLPSEVVQRLKVVDEHLATSIVKLCAGTGLVPTESTEQRLLPVVINARQWAICLPNDHLRQVEGIQLIPYGGGWLLSLEPEVDLRDLELRLRDLTEKDEPLDPQDQQVMVDLIQQLKATRLQSTPQTLQLLLYSPMAQTNATSVP